MQGRGQGSWRGAAEEDGEEQTERERPPTPHHGLSPRRLSLFTDWFFKKVLRMASQSVPQGRSQDQGKNRWEMLRSEENSTCKGPAAGGVCREKPGAAGMEGDGGRWCEAGLQG